MTECAQGGEKWVRSASNPPKKRAKTLCYAAILLSFLAFLFCTWKFLSGVAEDRRQESYNASLREQVVSVPTPQPSEIPGVVAPEPVPEPPPISVDFATLQAANPDVIGWIYCPDTEVNYPVLHSDDNRYYLRRLSDGTYNTAGSIFADCRNSAELLEENVILYGHNMYNGSMFALLPQYAGQEFYDAHPIWYLLTPTANYKVELFAGFVTSTKSLVYSVFREQTEDGRPCTDQAWEDSDFRGVDPPQETDRTLTLSTCSYEFTDARYVVMGVLREM